jgi:TRAP-type C4-dicarboxylate transport system permease small subunit
MSGPADPTHGSAVPEVSSASDYAEPGHEPPAPEEALPAAGLPRSVLRAIGLAEQAIGTALIVVILALVLLQVFQRYLPSGGWPWTGEVARLCLAWATFILSGYLLSTDRHVSIQVVDIVVHGRALGAVKTFAHAVVGVTCAGLAYATADLIGNDRGQVTSAAGIPLVFVYLVPLIGFVLTAVRAVVVILVADLPLVTGRPSPAR